MILTITILTGFFIFIHFIVGEEYEGLPEELHLQIKYFLDLLILREDLRPSQFSVILTEHSIYHMYCILLLFIIHLKCYNNNNKNHAHCKY